jgi:5-methyltetrahydropteroyltriglutamate--homocysteine methyltransferase
MAHQLKDEFYRDDEALAMDLAAAVNEEIRDLKAAGADVIQLDEPWLQAFPDAAARYGVKAINRALQDIDGATALHICFGYAQFVADKQTSGYADLGRFAESIVRQISIEAAQPRLDLGVLHDIASQQITLGVIDLGTDRIESPEDVADRIRNALGFVTPDRLILAPDCGMKYLDRATAVGKLTALSAGAELVRRELA